VNGDMLTVRIYGHTHIGITVNFAIGGTMEEKVTNLSFLMIN
jgi:hypothetical protein